MTPGQFEELIKAIKGGFGIIFLHLLVIIGFLLILTVWLIAKF